MPPEDTVDNKAIAKARFQASQRGGGVIHPEYDSILRDFNRIQDEDGRAAFADRWVRLAARRLDITWPAIYQLMRIIRDRRIYEDPARMDDHQAYSTFEEYWERVIGQSFSGWKTIEETYLYAETHKPELLTQPLPEATRIAVQERAKHPEYLGPRSGPVPGSVATPSAAPIGAIGTNRCRSRGENNADYLTARIARDFPEVLERMKAGEFKSVRQAAMECGIVDATIIIPADPVKAGRRLARHFTPGQIDQLVAAYCQAKGLPAD